MEEVVDATGAGNKKRKAVLTGKDNENQLLLQQSSSLLSKSARSVGKDNQGKNDDCSKRATPLLSADLPLPAAEMSCGNAVNDVLRLEDTLVGQSNHSRNLKSDCASGSLGLENGIGVKEELEREEWCLADSCSWHLPQSCSGSIVGCSQIGQTGLLGRRQRMPRRGKRQGTHALCRGGNMPIMRGHGLVRAVRGELEKTAASAQAGHASMQVLWYSVMHSFPVNFS